MIPERLQASLGPLLELVRQHTLLIKAYDGEGIGWPKRSTPRAVSCDSTYMEGAPTAVTYILTLEEKGRFKKSRCRRAYLACNGNRHRVNKPPARHHPRGDRYLRTLLVECAHRVMRGTDCDLRRFGERLTARGGKNQKKRAIIAVARKLAVLLHHLWVSGEVYEPLRSESSAPMAA
ncbi:MAG: hypothetical protein U0837_06775 [Dehalococcoidia bacterium]